jgi:hypothetical protein
MSDVLRTAIEEAVELTASLPENIQTIAFGKALDILIDEHETATTRGRRARRGSSRALRPRSMNRSKRIGPKLALSHLLEAGFFASGRTLPEIQSYLRNTTGANYESNELSISLLRLTRDARLHRDRNLAGQYEYWAEHVLESVGPKTLKQGKANARLLTDGKSMSR